jgi:hypothetical protein
MNGVIPIASRIFCRFLEANGWAVVKKAGDHVCYRYTAPTADGGTPDRSGLPPTAQVPTGGKWNRHVPMQSFKRVAQVMGLKTQELMERLR